MYKDKTDWPQVVKAIKKLAPNIYSEARRRTIEGARGCFCDAVKKNKNWTRMDCLYFGCIKCQTGCDLYNKLNDF